VTPSWLPLGDQVPRVTAAAPGAMSRTSPSSGLTNRTRVRSPPQCASWQAIQAPSGDQLSACTSSPVSSAKSGSTTGEPSAGSTATQACGRPSRSEIQASRLPSGDGAGSE
jgi:hypothetical protein